MSDWATKSITSAKIGEAKNVILGYDPSSGLASASFVACQDSSATDPCFQFDLPQICGFVAALRVAPVPGNEPSAAFNLTLKDAAGNQWEWTSIPTTGGKLDISGVGAIASFIETHRGLSVLISDMGSSSARVNIDLIVSNAPIP